MQKQKPNKDKRVSPPPANPKPPRRNISDPRPFIILHNKLVDVGEIAHADIAKEVKCAISSSGLSGDAKSEKKLTLFKSLRRLRRDTIARYDPSITGLRRVCIKRFEYDSSAITSSSSADVAGVRKMHLSDMNSYTEFTNLFDQYRLKSWKIHVLPMTLATSVAVWNGSATVEYTVDAEPLLMAWDPDDVSTPTLASIVQRTSLKVVPTNQGRGLFTVEHPMFALAAYQGAFTGYASSNGWIDCGYPGVDIYGLKYVWPQSNADLLRIRFVHELEWEFRVIR